MAEVLAYPLTPLPLSLCHVDGTMQKTTMVKLLNELEARVKSTEPSHVDVTVIDGMFFLHLLVNLPSPFGQVATLILRRICACRGKIMHLIFDKSIAPSIKDCESDWRSADRQSLFHVTGL